MLPWRDHLKPEEAAERERLLQEALDLRRKAADLSRQARKIELRARNRARYQREKDTIHGRK